MIDKSLRDVGPEDLQRLQNNKVPSRGRSNTSNLFPEELTPTGKSFWRRSHHLRMPPTRWPHGRVDRRLQLWIAKMVLAARSQSE
jgi:hypothetical protein